MITVPWGESITIASLDVHLFGLFTGLAVAASVELFRRQLVEVGVPVRAAYLLGLSIVLAGLAGAKVNHMVEHPPDSWTLAAAFDGAGLTWYGGVLAGVATLLFASRVMHRNALSLIDSLAAPAALGLAIGRVGCLAAADGDYGRPTNLPWGVAWPNGLVPTTTATLEQRFGLELAGPADRTWAVHPAPLYELVPLLVLAAVLFRFRESLRARPGLALGAWAIVAGAARFAVEEVRLNEPVLWGLTTPQVWSGAQVAIGAIVIAALMQRMRVHAAAPASPADPTESPRGAGPLTEHTGARVRDRADAADT